MNPLKPGAIAWLKEPFSLFLLLGLALFAADRVLNGAPADGREIVITAGQQEVLRAAFRSERGREPDVAETQSRLDRWIEEQVLYQEALALNLDHKDVIVRRQLTQKMRFLLEDAAALPPPSETELQDWLAQHPERYGQPPTLSFQQVFLSRGRHGQDLQNQAAQLGAQLQREPDSFAGLGDPFPTGQSIVAASPVQLRREFGPDFAGAVQQLPQAQWSGPLVSSFGLHLVRVTARSELRPAALEQVREQVRVDYEAAQHERLSREAVDRLKKKYRIEIEPVSG